MPNYLLEIGTEELPSGFLPDAQEQLKELMTAALAENHLNFEKLQVMGTPRRLAVKIHGLAALQETTSQKKKGPPLDKAYDSS
ncbi:MAG TPA: glycine--tRNA ligase subunit beta, partial [Chroococcales cyanobacterium]